MEHFEAAAALNDSLGQYEGAMIARQNRAEVLAASGDLAAARTALQQTLEEATQGEFLEDVVIARQRLARVAIRRGEWADAEQQLASADSAASSHKLEEMRAALVYDRGRLALGRGDLDGAQRLFSAFLAKTAPEDRLIRYTTRSRLAQVWAARGDLARAERELTEANGDLERWRASVGADELRSYAFAATAVGEYDSQSPAASVLAALARGGRAEAALTLAEQRRARTLADRLTQADALRETGASAELHRDRPATAAEIVAAMPDDSTALLEYVAGTDGAPTTLFVVTRAGVSAHELPTADSLKEPVARFVALLESNQSADALAEQLGRVVLGPAADLAAGVSRLIIVPDGPLHRLPFDALRLPDGRLAVERWAMGLAPSAAVATVLRRPRPAPATAEAPRVLALGDPAFAERAIQRPLPRVGDVPRSVRGVGRTATAQRQRRRGPRGGALLARRCGGAASGGCQRGLAQDGRAGTLRGDPSRHPRPGGRELAGAHLARAGAWRRRGRIPLARRPCRAQARAPTSWCSRRAARRAA